jgi:hypothetical protein
MPMVNWLEYVKLTYSGFCRLQLLEMYFNIPYSYNSNMQLKYNISDKEYVSVHE